MSYTLPECAHPFTLNISDQDILEWRQLLQLSKLAPETWEGQQEDRRYGVTRKWLAEAKDYWLNQYNWRAQEKHINSFPNYRMQIEQTDLHFVALFSKKKDAVPIVFMHGWPGSFIEFLPMLALIKEQYSTEDLPYHIIVPSLPGYPLSAIQSIEKKWTLDDTARIVNQLMVNLGFNKYLAQGGDVGSFVAQAMANTYEPCVGIHLNMMGMLPPPDENTPLTAMDKVALERSKKFMTTGFAYSQIHGTRPSTIGSVLCSNPLAILAWIGEKLLEWTEEDPSLDTMLTDISLYWFTGSFPACLYIYRQFLDPAERPEMGNTSKPMGFSSFPYEVTPGIKGEIEKDNNLVFYRQHEHGGHFAALEQPKVLWEDVEEFVGKAWKV
ncbi:epoxide hydrolase-like protein [Decorospora gaudefroyi]|uniref:Epoxide hydrolase-like protein n=1 Tax=Decorospora gaudefroyi TaxID=184978 RepID=A0A6A5KMY4_9PLEO|nr:epoxide hydrolase-like protein [Decorospora gaudefroyi]